MSLINKQLHNVRTIWAARRSVDYERYLFPGLLTLVGLSLIVVTVTTFSTVTLARTRAASRQATSTNIQLEQVYTSLREAESGQRGYVITGDESYLVPYTAAVAHIPQLFRSLDARLSDPSQQAKVDQAHTLSDEKLNELAETIRLRREQGFDAAAAVIQTNVGRNSMEKAHATLIALEKQINTNIAARDRTANLLLGLTLGSLAVLLLLTILVVYFVRRIFIQANRRSAELQKTNTELNRSNRELQDFASIASHDLQEPLRKIQAFSDRLVHSTDLDQDSQLYLDRILNAAGRMRVLIEDLLTFSRITTKAQPFTRTSLNRVVKEVLADLEIKIEDTHAQITLKKLPAIEADALQIRQLFQNLISNGLKFSQPGVRPVITISSKPVTIGSHEAVAISVSDNGIGFETKYLDRIFTIFQRLHGRDQYEGTGIGLAVVRKIAERHGGEVTAESEPGKGATFIVTLPIHHEHNILGVDTQ